MVDDAMDKRRHAGDMSTQMVHVVLDFVESAWFALRDRDANRDLFARAEIESAVVWVLEPFALALPDGLDDPALGDIVRKMSDRIAAAVVVAAHVMVETEATFRLHYGRRDRPGIYERSHTSNPEADAHLNIVSADGSLGGAAPESSNAPRCPRRFFDANRAEGRRKHLELRVTSPGAL